MSQDKSTRRQFLNSVARGAGVVTVGGAALALTIRADADKVWNINLNDCTACKEFNADPTGLSKCATECVLKMSAVKAVNDFSKCGYCMICPGYHDVNSPVDEQGIPTAMVCPYDAIIRTPRGYYDEADPNNNFYEYMIDESKCTGCGKCVLGCKPPMGNGSLRLEVRHNLCVDCNQCTIANACPVDAFDRTPVTNKRPGRHPSAGLAKDT